ncbi:MAG: LacI family DNA-binding transcriptional regulator [Gammaproteobacteria bacterium]|nr:LacI family DNA-binding transcriptional regulator [Gammaproteobacteria bacterium]
MATIYDVCSKAGVSMATVSRVINGNDNVRDKTRQKVLDAMKALGYKPNINAQSLASKVTHSIGILVSELYGPIFGPMMGEIESELRKSGKHVFIASGHSDADQEKENIEFLISRNCDALIMHVEAVSDEYLLELSKGDTPFVLLNRYVKGLPENCITLNNIHGGYLATKALLDMGHKDIAYISGPLWKTDASDRLEGHKNALTEYGINYNEDLLYEGDFHEESGINGLDNFLSKKQKFTALVCGNDEMASGAMVQARESDIHVPNDLSIIGYDDIDVAYYLHPKLTTIKYPVEKMGLMAARWVIKNVYNKDINDIQHTFEPQLIIRNSCKKIL